MIPVHQIETRRLKTQDALDAQKTQKERNKLGQFATPGSLALDIISYANSIIPREERIRFLDPAFGTGSFYSALLQIFDNTRIAQAMGFEVDAHYAGEAEKLWAGTGLELLVEDFTNA